MSDLQAYLAAKYMSGPKADAILDRSEDGKRRKRKRKIEAAPSVGSGSGVGLVIADEDGVWGAQENEDEEYKPVVEERRGQFKAKAKSESWATIREADPSLRPPSPTPEPEDEAPAIAGVTVETAPRGGLQTAADLRAEQDRKAAERERKRRKAEKEEARRKAEARARGEDVDEADPNATVYRDATGRRIDMNLLKAEEAQKKREELEKQMAKMEWGKGLVQKSEKERRAEEAEKLRNMSFARHADDAEMNEEMRETERWNDPAAAFLTKKKERKTKGPKFPTYQGPPPPPNRFNIPPGYRWDGVDRSNGFEKRLMERQNASGVFKAASQAWSMEDM
ncbi:pre-mRNA-splicing factor CWC26 [Rhodotorula toruloides]|uniref:Pre-mRNA-splicing factor CWC26 n=1 Tax=Rhodotorula toruloides TaxID=5286 RepID=A0A511KAI3_RHOTO|nr:pre-mRNA-splicing factor CWC26 [Rhodotorula toruloides]